MARLQKTTITVAATGSSGSASGSGSARLTGKIHSIHIQYPDGAPATTDITISQSSPAKTILAVSDNNTSGWYYPRAGADKAADGGNMTYDGTNEIAVPVDVVDQVTAQVAQTDPGTFTITIQYET